MQTLRLKVVFRLALQNILSSCEMVAKWLFDGCDSIQSQPMCIENPFKNIWGTQQQQNDEHRCLPAFITCLLKALEKCALSCRYVFLSHREQKNVHHFLRNFSCRSCFLTQIRRAFVEMFSNSNCTRWESSTKNCWSVYRLNLNSQCSCRTTRSSSTQSIGCFGPRKQKKEVELNRNCTNGEPIETATSSEHIRIDGWKSLN